MSYGGLPRSYDPHGSRALPNGSGYDPTLKAALASRTAANSPWPIDPASRPAPAVAAYDNSKPAEYTGQPLRRIIGHDSQGKPILGELAAGEAEAIERAEYITAEAARIRADKKPADILAFAGRLEAKAVSLRLEAAEAVRLEALASDQAGWLTAEAENRTGRAAELIEAEARGAAARLEAEAAEATSARIAAEAREAVAGAEASRTAEALEIAREAVAIGEALEAEAKTAEAGERIKLTAIIPADMRKSDHIAILSALEFDLAMQFGGYTIEKARGGWLDGSGDIVRDSSQVYSVSFDPAGDGSFKQHEKLIALFVAAGEALGEEWLHIERSTFIACHRKAS